MARTKEITIYQSKGAFSIFKKKEAETQKYDFSDVAALRQVLSKEKARILYVIKSESPGSIYSLAKKLGRSFKSVNDDVKLLERFGFIELIEESTKKRKRLKPRVVVDMITIHLRV
jgi:predicted transcriptional regulator